MVSIRKLNLQGSIKSEERARRDNEGNMKDDEIRMKKKKTKMKTEEKSLKKLKHDPFGDPTHIVIKGFVRVNLMPGPRGTLTLTLYLQPLVTRTESRLTFLFGL